MRGVPSLATVEHPLASLSAEEIEAAVKVARDQGDLADRPHFAYVGLEEPAKDLVRRHRPGDPVPRHVRLVAVQGPEARVVELVVAPAEGRVVSRVDREESRPALLITECGRAVTVLKEDPHWQEAMRRRGIEDFDLVQIDPWPSGHFGLNHETNRRIARCLSYLREAPDDNGYARPVEGVIGYVDLGRGVVLEVIDTGVVPVPPESGSYYPEDNGPLRSDLRPLEISQPEGPSFRVEGNLLEWQRWSMRLSMDPVEGLVLHQVGYRDGDRLRSILYRASICEMVVPYGEPGPMHSWKSAFDVGEWGLGRMADSLTLGCDCLGEIRYLDAVLTDERGRPYTLTNAICIHEEDYGILWKHLDMYSGRQEVRRSRRLVVSFIATVGNYEYGFYWYFYLDGTVQLEVKLTGIMSTMAIAPGHTSRFASLVAPGLAAPYHQHLFCARLDVEVDGADNTVEEVDSVPLPPGEDNPWGNAFETEVTVFCRESEARRKVDPGRSRHWRITNPKIRNRLGGPVAYKLVPGPTPTLLADPGSSVGRRAAFATSNLWVTPFDPEERRAAGEYPNQHRGGDGLPRWTAQDRPVVDRDLVLWHSFGVTHIPRPEDWPVMPVEYTGFHLLPVGFFERNPALDLPPSPAPCHDEAADGGG